VCIAPVGQCLSGAAAVPGGSSMAGNFPFSEWEWLPEFRQGSIDPRKHRRLSELGTDPLRLDQMLKCEGSLFLGLVEQTKNHLRAADKELGRDAQEWLRSLGFKPYEAGFRVYGFVCDAWLTFCRSSSPRVDSCGFESYSLECTECRAWLAGIIDPSDEKLVLSEFEC
jgi:hypothetical protein